jgi:hypothetical protein
MWQPFASDNLRGGFSMSKSVLLFIAKYGGGGLLSYATPRLLVAAGVPLDQWIVAMGGWLSLHLNREIALWAATFFVGAALYMASIIISKDHDWRPQIPAALKRLWKQVEPSHVIILGLVIALGGAIWGHFKHRAQINPQPAVTAVPKSGNPLRDAIDDFLAKTGKTTVPVPVKKPSRCTMPQTGPGLISAIGISRLIHGQLSRMDSRHDNCVASRKIAHSLQVNSTKRTFAEPLSTFLGRS